MICHIIYPLGTLLHIQLSFQSSKSSQKDNILDTKTKVETYRVCEITWSIRLLESFNTFQTRITTRMVFPTKFSDCHSYLFKVILSLYEIVEHFESRKDHVIS